MTTILSAKALAFLKEEHVAILSTINKDGTSQLTAMWYVLEDDGTIMMDTQVHLQKMKNIRRDARVALCIEDGFRYVSINGTLELNDDQEVVRKDLRNLVERYVKDEETRQQYFSAFTQQTRVALRLKAEKVIENL
ncbi:MAG TPA: PPOX class F420-dependent oxidoreductase [Ktedonobacteraceae bacterium]|jgi:PPOX class probable F420-dependent enzyme|nr:PPOX class F420-dependent oxidoreductase [Ktedonobacteraceae bacterium]